MKERSKTMKKKLALLLAGILTLGSFAGCGGDSGKKSTEEKSSVNADGELKGDITFWHSFTQGPRLEVIQETADQFMKDNPEVNITIETFSWGDFTQSGQQVWLREMYQT